MLLATRYSHTRYLLLATCYSLQVYKTPTGIRDSYRHTRLLQVYETPTGIQDSYRYTRLLQVILLGVGVGVGLGGGLGVGAGVGVGVSQRL